MSSQLPSAQAKRATVRAVLTGVFLLIITLTAGTAALGLASATAARPAVLAEPASAADGMPPRFRWPLTPAPEVIRGFAPPSDPYGPGHRGVDLGATPGQQVHAAQAGVVVFAGDLAGRGVISIQHDAGLRTTYEPVQATVTRGQQVFQGQSIGTVVAGHPECAALACLHWGVRRDRDEYLNPLMLVRTDTMIRLKPWLGAGPT